MNDVRYPHCTHCTMDGCDYGPLHTAPCGAEEDCPGAVPAGGTA